MWSTRKSTVILIVAALGASAPACEYSQFGFEPGDSSQTTVDEVFAGRFDERSKAKFLTQDWRNTVRDLQAQGAATGSEMQQLSLAWASHMASDDKTAIALYNKLLQQNPSNYEALCSYATVLHSQRQYDAAATTLKKAIQLKPGFRHYAEEMHLAMMEFEQKSRANFKYAQEHIFVDALTPIWKNRKGVEQNFSTVDFPESYTSKGAAELLRQYPAFGEGWMVLGMLLEHEKNFSMAAKAYDRALERGTAHAQELRTYMATFREFGRAQDPGRLVGRGIIKLIIGLVALFVFLKIFKVAARVINDVTSARAAKDEQARRKRLKNRDPDSPL